MSSVFFTDHDLGNLFPDMLSDAGISVERHRDHFSHDTPDEDWISAVSEFGWSVGSHEATRTRSIPARALRSLGTREAAQAARRRMALFEAEVGLRAQASPVGGCCAAAGGWKDTQTLVDCYQHADKETMLAVMSEPRKVSDRAVGT